MRAIIGALSLLASAAFAAPPNLALTWTGEASGADFMRLKCGGMQYDNATAPTQLTDATGSYVICGDGMVVTLVGVNSFGEGQAGGQLFIGVPGAAPIMTIITQ